MWGVSVHLSGGNVDHHPHSMHTPENHQLSTKNKYCSMSFVAINPKFLNLIDNYASYDMRVFRAGYTVYELGKLR